MKRLIFITTILLGSLALSAQNQINAYQYWFDNDFAAASTTTLTPGQTVNLQTDIDASLLTPGVHIFYLRFKDDNGLWSSPVAQFIYRISTQGSGATNEITEYQYWFDDAYDEAVSQTIPSTSNFQLISDIDATALSSGVHIFYLRFQDERGQWSSTVSQFIYKMAEDQVGLASNNIVAYQYWFDDTYDQAITEPVTGTQNLMLATDIDATNLNPGVHIFYMRFLDSRGQWSSTVSQFIYKVQETLTMNNEIIAYRYWFDDDFSSAVIKPVIPSQPFFFLQEQIDMTQMWKGEYTLHYQFKDTLGMWSSPTVDTIEKISLPIADFSYLAIQYCDSIVVTFTDNSIDGDEYLWDFGDGNTSNLVNPIYTYYTPSTYLVSLTVTDTILGIDSTLIIPLVINSLNSFASISETACDSYTAPDGQVYTTSGIKTAVIPNAAGCDSTITIDLTVNQSSTSSITETACDSYTAPDGQVYTTSGIKTAVIPNAAGCDSTITINLTVNQSSTSSITETACDSYTAPDGAIYTTSGIKTAVIPNAAGCDSTITIDLTINTVDVSVTQNETILTSNATDALYQWLDCLNSYSIITGETSQSFNATQNGNYAVQVTQNNCIDTSDCYEVTTFDILESTFSNNITVYPNPTDGILKIDLGENLPDFVVSIIDVNGKLIRQTTYKNTKMFELNLNVQSGIYFLMINSENKKATIRLIKN
ncbi:MAG: hypothetical protein PWQ43_820 [Rikenellaceae bacterium]|nr:hypothetical protein [Rikenellaceae bacterium]